MKFNFISSRNEGDGLPEAVANIMLEVENSQTEIADGNLGQSGESLKTGSAVVAVKMNLPKV